ncbi:MAG: glycosyltransferase [Bryobacterales bacterium]|nr:glycosyltransferase [Bryobacterales bacterium]
MRVVMFYHSLVSDWNHGNAHFLRGVATEMLSRGYEVAIFEPRDGWSKNNLLQTEGEQAVAEFRQYYPGLESAFYDLDTLNIEEALSGADLVLVHEWNDPQLVARIGEHHRSHKSYKLLFHDTHHRAVSSPEEIDQYDLAGYDGLLAFGESLRRQYAQVRPKLKAWTWHEAADVRVFHPVDSKTHSGDLVWVGNWGDDERSDEIREFLLKPAKALRLDSLVYGVRYPQHALTALAAHGVRYGGWLPNYRVPAVFAEYRVTVHIPRRPYARILPGIPTIRVFEALACGIPLVSAPWDDSEGLFMPGVDYLVASSTAEMQVHLAALMGNESYRAAQISQGLRTIYRRHTCGHRVDELMEIVRSS